MEEAKNNGLWKGSGEDALGNKWKFDLDSELARTESSEMFLEIRNLLMMTIIPKKMAKKDNLQSAYLKAAISRVNHNFKIFVFLILFFRFVIRLPLMKKAFFH